MISWSCYQTIYLSWSISSMLLIWSCYQTIYLSWSISNLLFVFWSCNQTIYLSWSISTMLLVSWSCYQTIYLSWSISSLLLVSWSCCLTAASSRFITKLVSSSSARVTWPYTSINQSINKTINLLEINHSIYRQNNQLFNKFNRKSYLVYPFTVSNHYPINNIH